MSRQGDGEHGRAIKEPAKTEPTKTELAPVAASKPSPGRVVAAAGAVHRAGPEICLVAHVLPSCTFEAERMLCKSDGQCTEHPHGRCAQDFLPRADFCFCMYVCNNDRECERGEVCTCGSPDQPGMCVLANCKSDSDSASGRCALAVGPTGCGKPRFACRTDQDTCSSNADCGKNHICDSIGGPWTCQSNILCTS